MSLENLLGRLLRSVRAGDRHLLQNDPRLDARPVFGLSSPDFGDGGGMPRRCAGAGVGDNVSPAIHWSGVPPAAVELGLVVQDPDAPLLRPVTHLIAFGIDPVAGGAVAGAFEAGASEFHFGRRPIG